MTCRWLAINDIVICVISLCSFCYNFDVFNSNFSHVTDKCYESIKEMNLTFV